MLSKNWQKMQNTFININNGYYCILFSKREGECSANIGKCIRGGGRLNIDCRFDLNQRADSTLYLLNCCRIVDGKCNFGY